MNAQSIRRRSLKGAFVRTWRNIRKAREIVRAGLSIDHPLLVHLIATRRCNLNCGYCNEFDNHSAPVPLNDLKRRIDKLQQLGTAILAVTGGEPMLHPHIAEVIKHARQAGMITGLITNGFFLSERSIEAFNNAGLDEIQISIDNVEATDVSTKSLRTLRPKFPLLRDFAMFDVRINSVIGVSLHNAQDSYAVAECASAYGFRATVGVVHDGRGQVIPLDVTTHEAYGRIRALSAPDDAFSRWFEHYFGIRDEQDRMAAGMPNEWSCRGGARYLYVCEDGKVHYCSQMRLQQAGVNLLDYTSEDILREFHHVKHCAPYCTIGCVHRVSKVDHFRYKHGPVTALVATAPLPVYISDGSAIRRIERNG